MKNLPLKILVCLLLIVTPKPSLRAWGFYAHQKINRLAVFCLPPEMFGFYKKHIDYISEHAVDPDKRRYMVPGEDVKHFIDMDYYETVLPFDTLPRAYHLAVAKYSKDTLNAYGIVPWNIQWTRKKLSEAFFEKDIARILKLSAELGHYIADAHVPLHATSNYNGQKTGQNGIHAFFESNLPELFSYDYNFFIGKAHYVQYPLDETWQAVEGSFACLDSVLGFEKSLQENFQGNKKYTYLKKGNSLQRTYSEEFSAAYHQMLSGMVERRMIAAITEVASFWYTAWVDAGQPQLDFQNQSLSDSLNTENFPIVLPDFMLGRQEK